MVRRVILLASILISGADVRAQAPSPALAKGMWIWQLWNASGGNLSAVIDKVKSVGATWVVIKMGDSDSYYNSPGHNLYTWASGYAGMDSVVSMFHTNGIKLLGYQYVYGMPHWGSGPSEGDVANMILDVKGIDGLLIDAEIQYDTLASRVVTSRSYMDTIRVHHPGSFVGLTSWARVVVHATFPWVEFLSKCDVNMPQTYWAARPTTPSSELRLMSNDFTTYTQIWVSEGDSAAAKPIEPLGQGEYFGYGSDVLQGDITSFAGLSQSTYGYQGISLWEYGQITHQYVWDEYASAWPLMSVSGQPEAVKAFELYQNYPNPFNPKTEVRYQVPEVSKVRLIVYDLLGREVATLVNGQKGPGRYEAKFDGSGLPSGMYFCSIQSGSFKAVKKMLLVK